MERRKWYANNIQRERLMTVCVQRNSEDESYFFLIILRNINGINKRLLTTQKYI